MGRLNWNYAARSRWNRPWLAVGVVAVAGCVHALWWRDTLLTRRNELVEQAERLSRRVAIQRHPAAPAVPAALDPVFAAMRYPWLDMLDSLRAATPPGVEVLTLEPAAGAIRRVHIGGVADQAQSVFDLITMLRQDPDWSSVQLLSQSRSGAAGPSASRHAVPALSSRPGSTNAPSATLSFSLLAEWGRP